ncbi:hypothetical protein BKP38_03160 [Lacticaseibacillus rhamnosus]|uniref:hypothetical protein n=1 Tax=Lacticaseibacillus rhamnosus TaxID=47715 RepID=UPI0008A58033|nr:hypothetical protein [Lacticaseibacillus rhamnosus]OHF14672.1 hypothetical protein BKP38_03160 [Lacticaseibacillus rhamnosus]
MSNETKQDVFNALMADMSHGSEQWRARYDAAFPDDLPVIPKEIGEYIERQKQGSTLRSAIIAATDFHAVDDEEADWIFYHSDTFARAWLLGVWIVEETGEIVKLEVKE